MIKHVIVKIYNTIIPVRAGGCSASWPLDGDVVATLLFWGLRHGPSSWSVFMWVNVWEIPQLSHVSLRVACVFVGEWRWNHLFFGKIKSAVLLRRSISLSERSRHQCKAFFIKIEWFSFFLKEEDVVIGWAGRVSVWRLEALFLTPRINICLGIKSKT